MRNRLSIVSLLCSFTFVIAISYYAECSDVSLEAERHMARGQAAVEGAEKKSDYEDAIKEFELAVLQAPTWADAYYNLGLAQEGAGQYKAAIQSLQKYIKLVPKASDAKKVQKKIFKLEYMMEKAERPSKIDLAGTWVGSVEEPNTSMYSLTGNDTYRIETDEKDLRVFLASTTGVRPYSFFGNFNVDPVGEMVFRLHVDGDNISGEYIQPCLGKWSPVKEFPVTGKLKDDNGSMELRFNYSYNFTVVGSDKVLTHSSDLAILTLKRQK